MRRDYFTLDVTTGNAKPQITVSFEGPAESFEDRLLDETGMALDAEQIDVAYRLHDDAMDSGESGVLSVTNRITGDFILECNANAGTITRLINAARENDGSTTEGRYHFSIDIDGREVFACDRDTFLVYNTEGDLLRQHSLIPSGVEL